MKTFEVEVTRVVRVSLDETQFTPEFMAEFRENFFDLDTIEGHAAHLAQLHARGMADNFDYIEGYSAAPITGITFEDVAAWMTDASLVEPGA